MSERRYSGKTWAEMNKVLDMMCAIENRLEFTHKEQEAFDITIQCVTDVMNQMKDDSPIIWDEEEE